MRRSILLVLQVVLLLTMFGSLALAANPNVNITLDSAQPDPTTVSFTASFDQPVFDFTANQVVVGGTADASLHPVTCQNLGDSMHFRFKAGGMKGSGTVKVSIPIGSVMNGNDEVNTASNTVITNYTMPPVKSTVRVYSMTSSKIELDVTFAEAMTWFISGVEVDTDPTTSAFGNSTPRVTVLGLEKNYRITITGMDQNGAVSVTLPEGVTTNANGVPNAATNFTAQYAIGNPIGTLTPTPDPSLSVPFANPTCNVPSFLLQLNQVVKLADLNGIVVDGGISTITPTVSISPNDGGYHDSYVIGVKGLPTYPPAAGKTGVNVSVKMNIASGAFVNPYGDQAGSFNSELTLDTIHPLPAVTVSAGQGNPTSKSPIGFEVVFSQPVTGFTNSGVVINGTASSGATAAVTAVGTGGTNYHVAVSGMKNVGYISIGVSAGVAANGTVPNAASTMSEMVAFNDQAAVATITQAGYHDEDCTNISPIVFDVQWTKPVDWIYRNVTDAQHPIGITLTGTSLGQPSTNPNGTLWKDVDVIDTGNHMDYKLLVYRDPDIDSDGSVTVAITAKTAQDFGQKDSVVNTYVDPRPAYDNTVYYVAHPRFTISPTLDAGASTGASPVRFVVTFTKPVGGFNQDDILDTIYANYSELQDVAFTVQQLAPFNDTVFEVDFTGMAKTEMIGFSVNSTAGYQENPYISPYTGNPLWYYNLSHATRLGGDSSQQLFDNEPLTCFVQQAPTQSDPCVAAGPINFVALFNKPVTLFSAAGVRVTGTANAQNVVVTNPKRDGMNFNIAVTGMQNVGTVIVNVPSGCAMDPAGNLNKPSTTGPLSNNDNIVTYSPVPTVMIDQASDQIDPASTSPIKFSVVFSEPVKGFGVNGVSITGTAFETGVIPGVTVTNSGNDMNYTVLVTGMVRTGTVVANVLANCATNASGVQNTTSTSADNIVTWNRARPTVTIDCTDKILPNATDIFYSVVFSKLVNGFSSTSLRISSTAGPVTAVVKDLGDGARYLVALKGMTKTGTIKVTIPEAVVKDDDGNYNMASTSTNGDNVVNYLRGLSVTIDKAADQYSPTSLGKISFVAVFSAPVIDFTGDKVVLKGSAVGPKTVASVAQDSPNNGTIWKVTVTGIPISGTVTASIAADTVHDTAGNPNLASNSTDNTVYCEAYNPNVTVEQAVDQADPARLLPIHYVATFTTPVVGFDESCVILSPAPGTGSIINVVPQSDGLTYDIYVGGQIPEGDIRVSVAAGAVQSVSDFPNLESTSIDNRVTYDSIAPTFTIGSNMASNPTNVSPVTFLATFSEPVSSPTVLISGTAGATAAVVTGGPIIYNITVNNVSQDGSVIASILTKSVADLAGNLNTVGHSASIMFDDESPTVALTKAVGQADPAAGSTVKLTATFSEAVTGFDSNAVTLGGDAVPTSVLVTDSGDHRKYNLAISGMKTVGAITAAVNAAAVRDMSGNIGVGSASISIMYNDGVRPTATLTKADSQQDPTNASPINYSVVFSKPVEGFGASGVSISGTAGATIANVTGSGQTYNIAVSGMTTPGTVIVSIVASAAKDSAGNGNLASSKITVAFDNASPTAKLTLAAGMSSPSNASPLKFTVAFNKAVTGFGSAGVSVSGTAGATSGAVSDSGDHKTYTISVNSMTQPGTVTVGVSAAAARDTSGNPSIASNTVTATYDNTAPSVTIAKVSGQPNPTNKSSVNFTVTFSKPVTGLGSSGVTLAGTTGATSAVVTGSGVTYNVLVSGMIQPGTLSVSINAGAAKDSAGNTNSASNVASVDFDNSTVSVTAVKADTQADPANVSPINFTVKFTKDVTGFNTSCITLGGTAGATSSIITGSGSIYNVAVSGMTTKGVVTLTVKASVVKDAAGNVNTSSNTAQVQFDSVGPTVTINQADGQQDPAKSGPINFKVVFSKSVTGFSNTGVTLGGTAGANSAVVTGSGSTYNVAVSGMTISGTVTATVNANAATDSAGNGNKVSTSADNTVTFDNVPLTVTVSRAAGQTPVTSSQPVNFTVTFNKSVSDFRSSAVVVTGTAGGTKKVVVTGTGTTYNVAISEATSTGTVIVDVSPNSVHDNVGNANAKSSLASNTVTFDIGLPTLAFTKPTSATSCTRNSKLVSIAGTASDDTGVVEVDWSTEAGDSGVCTGTTSWSADNLSIENGQDTITVVAKDAAGNKSTRTLSIKVVEVSPGDAWQGLCMVSLPIIPDDTDPKNVVGFSGNAWAFFNVSTNAFSVYSDKATWFIPVDETPGRGYWARFNTTGSEPTGMIPAQDKPITLYLKPGWNLIGQPFITPVKWDLSAIKIAAGTQEKSLEEAANAGWVGDYAWGWTPNSDLAAGGEYYLVYDNSILSDAVGELAPWQAYWIFANYNCELILPAP